MPRLVKGWLQNYSNKTCVKAHDKFFTFFITIILFVYSLTCTAVGVWRLPRPQTLTQLGRQEEKDSHGRVSLYCPGALGQHTSEYLR